MAYDISTLKRKILARYPFFGSVIASVDYEETEDVRTIANDGRTIFYRAGYLAGLTMEEQIFVLTHELCHIAFHHIARGQGKDSQVWKAATDAVINQLLKRDGMEIPKGGIDYPEAIEYDAEEYYGILLKEKLEMELVGGRAAGQAGPGQGSDGDGSSMKTRQKRQGDDGLEPDDDEDDHSLWEEAAEQLRQKQRQDEEDLMEEMEKIREMAKNMKKPEDSGDMDESDEGGEQDGSDEGGDEDQEDEFAIIGAKVSKAGNDISPDLRQIGKVGTAAPVIDWRMVLRDTLNYGVDWSYRNAVIEDGILRPALEEVSMPETEIVLDASWSVDDELLRNFLRECRNILQHSKLKAGCFDTVFYGFHEIRTEEDIEKLPLEGGGGTDFNVAVGAFSKRVDNKIIFTDGQADMPEEPLDAIWMVWGGEKIEPKGGRVIHITDEQLERLLGVR